MQAKQKMEKVKANLSALEIFCIQIYEAANETKGSKHTGMSKSVDGQAEESVPKCMPVETTHANRPKNPKCLNRFPDRPSRRKTCEDCVGNGTAPRRRDQAVAEENGKPHAISKHTPVNLSRKTIQGGVSL